MRNRRQLLREEIHRCFDETEEDVRITSLASGPAAELFDVFADEQSRDRLHATMVDIDLQALAHVSDRLERENLKSQARLVNGNLVYLATGREKLEAPPQHLVYSIGLIDYFSDKFVVKLMNFGHDLLAKGGRMILGNFHPRNPNRAFMDHALEWKLIHRDEADLNRLYQASKFGRECTAIRFEAAGVNLFAECRK